MLPMESVIATRNYDLVASDGFEVESPAFFEKPDLFFFLIKYSFYKH
jgi:hypothetical protein